MWRGSIRSSCSACPAPVLPSVHRQRMRQLPRGLAAHPGAHLGPGGITEPIEFLFAFTAPLAVSGPCPADRAVARHLQRARHPGGQLLLRRAAGSGAELRLRGTQFWLIPGIPVLRHLCPGLLPAAGTPLSLPSKPIAEEHPRLATVAPRSPDAGDPVPQDAGGMDNLGHERLPDPPQPAGADMALVDQSRLARLGCLLDPAQRASAGAGAGPHAGPSSKGRSHAGGAPVGPARSRTQSGAPSQHQLIRRTEDARPRSPSGCAGRGQMLRLGR